MSTQIERAKLTLQAAGYVVLRSKSYRQAQERQRIAEALKQCAEEDRESTRRWAEGAFDEQRRLSDRLTFVYGVARAHGATEKDLRQPAGPTLEQIEAVINRSWVSNPAVRSGIAEAVLALLNGAKS